jgi:ribosome-associated translation inhibitor RaiA
MRFSDSSYNLRIELDQNNCDLSGDVIERFERALEPLRKPVAKFPVSDLYITVTYQPRSQIHHVKMALVLSGRTLAVADPDPQVLAAFDRCVSKLIRRVLAYEADLGAEPELHKHRKGTHQDILPESEPDIEQLEKAVRDGDYAAFRTATYVYEESVRKRVGRLVERFPELNERIGIDWTLEDMVEEVFLMAFEQYESRPREVRLGEWLEQRIEPSLKLLSAHPDEEMENINFARTLREAARES